MRIGLLAFDSDQTLEPRLAAAHRTASIIVMAIALSVVVYIVIGLLAVGASSASHLAGADQSLSPAVRDTYQVRTLFYAAAIFLVFASIMLRRIELRWAKLQAVARVSGIEAVPRHLTNVAILSSALGEVVGLLGLFLGFLSGDQADVFRLCAVALVAVLLNYPRRAAWERTIDYLAHDTVGSAPEA
jgi:hypothetical protein